MNKNKPSAASGFSLLEVIVATAVMAMVFVAMMEIFSGGMRTEGKADEYSTAMQHATQVMNELIVYTRDAAPRQTMGNFEDGYGWHASVDVFRLPDESQDSSKNLIMEKLLLHVEVGWTSRGSEKKVTLDTVKNVLRESSKS